MDSTGVPEWAKKRHYLAAMLTNFVFEVADVLECLFIECSDAAKECGLQFSKQQKNHFEFAQKHIKAFRSSTAKLDKDAQLSFGQDTDVLADLIYAAVTRTGEDDQMMQNFLEYIMSYPDKVGLDGVRKGGELFESIKMKQAKARIEAKINKQ